MYFSRARRAKAANDLDRYLANLELTLLHLREAARIYRASNHMRRSDDILRRIADIEKNIQHVGIARAATTAAAADRLNY